MFYTVIAALLIGLASSPALSLTMEEAVAMGLKNNPEMQAFRLEEEAATGEMAKAKLPSFSNPVIEGSLSRQDRPAGEPGGPFRNNQVSLSQTIEIAGQRPLRIDAAARNIDRTRLEVRDLERRLRADIRDRFVESLFLRDRELLLREFTRIQEELTDLVEAKYQAGDVAALEVNLSQVELARARRDLISASTEYEKSLLALGTLVGIAAGSTVRVEGELAAELPSLPERDTVVARATERPDVKASQAEIRRSSANEKLVRREAIPGITWGIFHGRAEDANETGATLGITIPLFDRKQGERVGAKVRLSQARIREAGAMRTAQREIEEAHSAAASSLREVDLLKEAVLGRTLENLDLLQLAFREGKISFYDVRVAQRETIDTRNVYLQALLTAQRSFNALERAIGGELR